MLKREHMPHFLGAATLALLFSAASVHPQSTDAGVGTTRSTTAMPAAGTSGAGTERPQAGSDAANASTRSASSASKAGDKDSKLSRGDRNILENMAYSNISEIAMGKMALEKSKDEKVKQYAQKMVDDHTKAQEEVRKVADAKGVKLPDEPDAKHKTAAKAMEKLSAEEFDRKYMAQGGLADHKKTHKQLESAQSKAKDPDVKKLAAAMLPTVSTHLKEAQSMTGNKSAAKTAFGDSKVEKERSSGSSASGNGASSSK